jgi:histone acetyltransferase
MYCQVYPEIDYFNFPQALDKQMEFLQEQVGKRCFKGVFPKEDIWLPYPSAPHFLNRPLPELVPMFASQEAPADEFRKIQDYGERMNQLRRRCSRILQQLQAEESFSRIFERPVTEALAPKYFVTITRPMDFSTVRKRLRRFHDYYKRPEIFAADIDLIIENCKRYNPIDTVYHKAALSLKQMFRELYVHEFPEVFIDR